MIGISNRPRSAGALRAACRISSEAPESSYQSLLLIKGCLLRTILLFPVLAVSLLALSSCGQTPGCRALTGAGIGATGGAVLGAIGGHPLLGAAAGAAAGAAVIGLTTIQQFKP